MPFLRFPCELEISLIDYADFILETRI